MARTLQPVNRATVLGFSGYHWLVILAGWAGWGFDVFDALLFRGDERQSAVPGGDWLKVAPGEAARCLPGVPGPLVSRPLI
jgi:hypothetical protein